MVEKQQEAVDFGFEQVNPEEKTRRVRGVFESVASKYDIMNDLMSGGLHRLWKHEYVKQIRLRDGMKILDLAGGTGDIAFKLLEKAAKEGKQIDVYVTDINDEMLKYGKLRAVDRCITSNIQWQQVNAEDIPFDDEMFDVITMAYGIRNVTHKDKALAEMHRVLKSAGQLTILEFAPVELPIVKEIYGLYSKHIIPQVGELVTGDRDSYQYFVESIQKFPTPRAFASMIETAGFESVRHRAMTFGVTNIHTGWKA